jgi:hypothetical protein
MALWSSDILEELRLKVDPFGDKVAESVFEFIGNDRARWQKYMERLATLDYFELPTKDGGMLPLTTPLYSKYFSLEYDNGLTPEKRQTLQNASLFFEKNGPAIIMTLAARSLLKQYSSANTSELLGRTKLLVDHADRRIIETMQFVMDVMAPGWLKDENSWTGYGDQKGSPSIQTIKKLRLTHSMIRSRVRAGKLGDWDEYELDAPINQEDMIMANLTFSLEVIEGLRALNIEVSEDEQNDFFHAWLIIGDMLGIEFPDGLKPKTYEEGWALQNLLYERNFDKKNEYAPKLAEALIQWLDKTIPMTNRTSLLEIIKEINGDANIPVLEKFLDLDFSNLDKEQPTGSLNKIIKKLRSISTTANRTFFQEVFHHMVNELLGLERGGEKRRFSIIAGFEKSWEMLPDETYAPMSNMKVLLKMLMAILKVSFKRLLRTIGLSN